MQQEETPGEERREHDYLPSKRAAYEAFAVAARKDHIMDSLEDLNDGLDLFLEWGLMRIQEAGNASRKSGTYRDQSTIMSMRAMLDRIWAAKEDVSAVFMKGWPLTSRQEAEKGLHPAAPPAQDPS